MVAVLTAKSRLNEVLQTNGHGTSGVHPPAPPPKTDDLDHLLSALDMARNAKKEDVVKIDQRIGDCEKELARLKSLRNILTTAGVVAASMRKPRGLAVTVKRRVRCVAYLRKYGATNINKLCTDCEIPQTSRKITFIHQWFQITGDVIKPTARALKEVL